MVLEDNEDRSPRVLHVHNFYKLPGGEDECFVATGAMLEDYGHEVIRFTLQNAVVDQVGKLTAASMGVWNPTAYSQLRRLIRATRPEVAHFENTFPLVSPSAYYACHAEGVPVVQTLHNFRLVCPSAILYRDGRVCEECLPKGFAWPSIQHRCYRRSFLGSGAVSVMLAAHRALRTWSRRVDAYIALNSFVRAKFIEAGFEAEKVHINHNFLPVDPQPGDGAGGYAVFAGRLTPEKGVKTLLAAWSSLGRDLGLKILGDGPEAHYVADAAAGRPGTEWLGWRQPDEVLALMSHAKFVVVPSAWYEGFNRILMESFAKGTPVIATNLGSMRAIVDHGRTGLLFAPNDPQDLVRQVRRLLSLPAEEYMQMRLAARREFETHYTAKVAHERLLGIYDAARGQMERRIRH